MTSLRRLNVSLEPCLERREKVRDHAAMERRMILAIEHLRWQPEVAGPGPGFAHARLGTQVQEVLARSQGLRQFDLATKYPVAVPRSTMSSPRSVNMPSRGPSGGKTGRPPLVPPRDAKPPQGRHSDLSRVPSIDPSSAPPFANSFNTSDVMV